MEDMKVELMMGNIKVGAGLLEKINWHHEVNPTN